MAVSLRATGWQDSRRTGRGPSLADPHNDLASAATGLTDSAVAGSRQSQAVYLELDVPISQQIDLDLSDREDRYSDFGRTNNGKVSVRYQPAGFLTFRGTASTGFRAPTLHDLHSPDFIRPGMPTPPTSRSAT